MGPAGRQFSRCSVQSLALIGTDRLERISKAEAQLDLNDR
jgi:hypothetical protein